MDEEEESKKSREDGKKTVFSISMPIIRFVSLSLFCRGRKNRKRSGKLSQHQEHH
ncbi:MAG: hypothetical protein Q8N98_05430 [bacterium]|nr:hypothetical protein [bacterium]